MQLRANNVKSQIGKLMTPSFIAEDDLDSGMQMNYMYLAMLKLILYPADLMAKITVSVKRMHNVLGEGNLHTFIIHVIISFKCIDKAASRRLAVLSYDRAIRWRIFFAYYGSKS